MPRTYKAKGVHTTPEKSGEHNLTEEYIESHQDKNAGDGLMTNLTEMFISGTEKMLKRPRTSAWTAEELLEQCIAYFRFADERGLKPSKSGLQVFLGVGKTQYWEWQTKADKYGDISNVITQANATIENQYINRGEKYPTMNVFLLKTSHEYIEQSKLDITTNGESVKSATELNHMVSKLGLDK